MATNNNFFKDAIAFLEELKGDKPNSQANKELQQILTKILSNYKAKFDEEVRAKVVNTANIKHRRVNKNGVEIGKPFSYRKTEKSQTLQALAKLKVGAKKPRTRLSDAIAYFCMPKTEPMVSKKGKKLLIPREYYTMLEWGIVSPHSTGKGNINIKGVRQRLHNTMTSKGYNKGYYYRKIDNNQKGIDRAEDRIRDYQMQMAKGKSGKTVTRQGRKIKMTFAELIAESKARIDKYRKTIEETRERIKNVALGSGGKMVNGEWVAGTHDVIKTSNSHQWVGKRYANKGVEIMQKMRKNLHSDNVKKYVQSTVVEWIEKKLKDLNK